MEFDVWDGIWLGWIGAFVVVEGVALKRGQPGDTLSEKVWKWFGIGTNGHHPKRTTWVQIRRVALLGFMTWLTVHFMSGGWL
ncbi:hypothetical protein [Actinocorallia libanotica]|uniref:Uncharacterized protein n=1 Tax=Actinocorallia libanotica TaxID=46162 RepID=A0ABN1QQI6_9ACTN